MLTQEHSALNQESERVFCSIDGCDSSLLGQLLKLTLWIVRSSETVGASVVTVRSTHRQVLVSVSLKAGACGLNQDSTGWFLSALNSSVSQSVKLGFRRSINDWVPLGV